MYVCPVYMCVCAWFTCMCTQFTCVNVCLVYMCECVPGLWKEWEKGLGGREMRMSVSQVPCSLCPEGAIALLPARASLELPFKPLGLSLGWNPGPQTAESRHAYATALDLTSLLYIVSVRIPGWP